MGSVWGERTGRVQRELHGAGDGSGECERIDCQRDGDAGRSGLLVDNGGEHQRAGTWDTAAAVNLIGGQNMTFFAGNLLKGSGGYTVWNAGSSASYGTQVDGGGGTLPGGGTYAAWAGSGRVGSAFQVDQFPGADIGPRSKRALMH